MKTEECNDGQIVSELTGGPKIIIIQYPVIKKSVQNFELAECIWLNQNVYNSTIRQSFPIVELKIEQE
jgi:hypothetical protein